MAGGGEATGLSTEIVMNRLPITMRTIAVLAVVTGVGCASEPRVQQQGPVLAAYSFRTLTADLGMDFGVPVVVTAAEQALNGRGYTISSRRMTEDSGRVVAVAPGSRLGHDSRIGLSERVVISATLTAMGTRVRVTAQPLGNEAISRAILDDILLRLGL